ncbi:MAG: methyl viologen-reducing hydrogenase [Candidatus Brocadiae bacterium]|nr:methyl viologen-reducing hydrogenase [Candidatus Brocadiia bacterium]
MTHPRYSISTDWLSGCGGCEVAIVDLDIEGKLAKFLNDYDLVRCPVLMDTKEYPKANLGIITGAIRSKHDRESAKAMRESCDKLIAFGTCAAYGGISGAGYVHSKEEILNAVFQGKENIPKGIPEMEQSPKPADEEVKIDLYLPGCPPHPAYIFDALNNLLKEQPSTSRPMPVCSTCRRIMKKTEVSVLKKYLDGTDDGKTCLLSQGYLCLGSLTMDRCKAPCPQRGIPCIGCGGPTLQIILEPNRDLRTELAERMSRLTNMEKEKIVHEIEASAKTHYAYTMSSQMINRKQTFNIKKWIQQ